MNRETELRKEIRLKYGDKVIIEGESYVINEVKNFRSSIFKQPISRASLRKLNNAPDTCPMIYKVK